MLVKNDLKLSDERFPSPAGTTVPRSFAQKRKEKCRKQSKNNTKTTILTEKRKYQNPSF